jgi:Barstar (barnase inhibitor)
MLKVSINCDPLRTETEFWDAYLRAVQPEGAAAFGRNLNALRDALLGGGPGWPGDVELSLLNSDRLRDIDQGSFFAVLEQLSVESEHVRILLS